MKIISNVFASVPVDDRAAPDVVATAHMRAFNKRHARRLERRQVKQFVRSLDVVAVTEQRPRSDGAAFKRFMKRTLAVIDARVHTAGVSIDAAAPLNSDITRTTIRMARRVGDQMIHEDVCVAVCC